MKNDLLLSGLLSRISYRASFALCPLSLLRIPLKCLVGALNALSLTRLLQSTLISEDLRLNNKQENLIRLVKFRVSGERIDSNQWAVTFA